MTTNILYQRLVSSKENKMQDKKKSLSNSDQCKIQIECIFDTLSEAQIQAQEKYMKEYDEFKKKFEHYTANKAELNITRGDLHTFVEFVSSAQGTLAPTAIPVVPVNSAAKQNGRVANSSTPQNNQILLVNNQRLGLTGLIVPTVPLQSPTTSSSPSLVQPVSVVNVGGTNVAVTSVQAGSFLTATTKSPTVVTRVSSPQLSASNQSNAPPITPKSVEALTKKYIVQSRPLSVQNVPVKRPLDTTPPVKQSPLTVTNLSDKIDPNTAPPPAKKKFQTPSPTVSIDLTEDLTKIEAAGSTSGKTYPSLVVMAKPCMRNDKEAKSPAIVKEKQALDAQVRRVLLFTPQNFTEWLIQTGLLKCDHYCSLHKADDGTKIKLKLGQYMDNNKFPFSGGYVWVSDCCPQTYISVFSGSVFEGASYPPTTTLKLIYHWACHTSIQNVLMWVKVTNFYIKNLFTNLRAVCTAAVHEHYEVMGGKGKRVQVGVVSLGGTATKDSSSRKIRMDILALLDPDTKVVRVRAIEPIPEPDRFVLRKFTRIFEILPQWVDLETTLLVDNTVERTVLYNMGFKSITHVMVKDKKGVDQFPNHEIMDYLRLIIPKMFQNSLSILSRHVIQQFLDELCWRERWGPFPARAFDTIIKHLIEQTKINSGAALLNRLTKISSNPFRDWKYSKWRSNCVYKPSKPTTPPAAGCGGPPQKVAVTTGMQLMSPPSAVLPPTLEAQPPGEVEAPSQAVYLPARTPQGPVLVEAAKILLEPYFYGTIPGDKGKQNQLRGDELRASCVVCRKLASSVQELTDHLIRHGVAGSPTDTKDLCKICCKVFPSQYFVQQHHVQLHSGAPGVPSSARWCLMCNTRFKDTPSLVSHLSRFHGELELPYHCQVCGFRTSIFMKMIQHINQAHKLDDVAFCPYCFKSVRFSHNGKPDVRNQYKFISHIQRHQLPLVKKCYKCLTTCLNKTVLNEHEVNHHKSFANDDSVERYSTSHDTFMPAPLEDPLTPKGEKFKLAVGGPYKVVNFPTPLIIDEEDSNTVCVECDAKINDNHFMSELLCMKCDYSTCCIRAMNEHYYSIHSYVVQIGKIFRNIPVINDTNLNCSCSFSTKDGNAMANHLILCKKVTCYEDPKYGGDTDIQSLIGQKPPQEAAEGEKEPEEIPEPVINLDATYTVFPSTSTRNLNTTYIVHK